MNLSALQVQSDDLANAVVNALAWSGLAADRLELEVTESIFLRQGPRTEATLKKLGGLGVGLALDDFGTGYSSLGYLQRAAFSKIKIDRSADRPDATDGLFAAAGLQVRKARRARRRRKPRGRRRGTAAGG